MYFKASSLDADADIRETEVPTETVKETGHAL